MSVAVPLEELESVARRLSRAAYVLAGTADGPPRITHCAVRFVDEVLEVDIGRGMAAAMTANPRVSVLWAAPTDGEMSLIVDADVVRSPDPDGGPVTLRPTGAVRHRPAPS